MNILLLEKTIVITSSAPGKQFISSVVCFQDSFYIILHVDAYTFHVNQNPIKSYNFGDDKVETGLQKIIDSCATEEELKSKLLELNRGNTTLTVNFSDFKKVKINSLFGVKTLKAMNNAMSYVSCNANKTKGKELAEFYAHL